MMNIRIIEMTPPIQVGIIVKAEIRILRITVPMPAAIGSDHLVLDDSDIL